MSINWRARLPVLLSALVYPGIGQCVQRRWLVGLSFALAFTGVCIWFFMCAMMSIIASWQLFSDHAEALAPEEHSVLTLLLPFGLMLVIYLGNVVDVIWHRRVDPSAVPPVLTNSSAKPGGH